MALGERGAEPPDAAVRVAVQLGERAVERLEGRRNGPNGALVGGELDAAGEAELALDLLDRLARLVRDEALDERSEEALGDLGDGGGHAWTVAALESGVLEIGLFPLELVLLPSERVPLHIFEDRVQGADRRVPRRRERVRA